METWLLILFINGSFTRESYSVSLAEFDTKELCAKNGIQLASDLYRIRNKDEWAESVSQKARYSCHKIIR